MLPCSLPLQAPVTSMGQQSPRVPRALPQPPTPQASSELICTHAPSSRGTATAASPALAAAQTPLEAISSGFHRRPSRFLTDLWHFTGGETEALQYKKTSCLPTALQAGSWSLPQAACKDFNKVLTIPPDSSYWRTKEERGSPHMQNP